MAGINAWLNAQQMDIPAPVYKVQSPDTIQIIIVRLSRRSTGKSSSSALTGKSLPR